MHPMTRDIRNSWHLSGADGAKGLALALGLVEIHLALIHRAQQPRGLAVCPFPDTSGWEAPGLETGKPHSREECPPGTLAIGTQVLQEQLLALCTSLCESPC